MASRKGLLTLLTATAAKLLFQFKSDLEFKCVSHLGHTNFPRQFIFYYSSLAILQSKQIKHFKQLYDTSTGGCEGTITVFWSSSQQRLFRQLNKEQPEFAR